MKLKDRVAIVTGAGTGIGKAISIGYAKEGADVAVVYTHSVEGANDTVAQVEAAGRRGIAVQCDMGDPESIRRMVKQVYDAFGRIDILVNNGAVFNSGLLLDQPLEAWDQTFNTNCRGAFLSMQAVAPYMEANGYGKIINITSMMAYRVSMVERMAYATSKIALIGLGKAAARSLGKKGICVNGIAPGTFIRDGFKASPEVLRLHDECTAVGRCALPPDIVGTAVFLASHDSDYVSGIDVLVDGGWVTGD